jgi:glycosyltransferase involved in cell wall biosynthesis
MYPPHHLGGYELMWRSAVGFLRERGHEVRVLATDHREAQPDPAIAEDADVHRELRWYWREHDFPRLSPPALLRLERGNGAVLQRHVEEFRPDAVSWWAMGGMSLSLIERVRRAGVPAAFVVVDEWLLYGPQVDAWQRTFGRNRAMARLAEAISGVPSRVDLGAAGHWQFVSAAVRDRALERHPDLTDSSIAHAGIDPSRFGAAPPRPWGWRLLYLGRIDERKGIDTAIRALRHLPKATLRVVGWGDDGHLAELHELARETAAADRVEFDVVDRDAVAAAYAEADATLFPVRWDEPWGLVPLESMAVGTPVIATGSGGSGEYLRDRENCLIFAPRDDDAALAAAIAELAADGGLRERLRQGGIETARRFTEEAFNEAVERALGEVLR